MPENAMLGQRTERLAKFGVLFLGTAFLVALLWAQSWSSHRYSLGVALAAEPLQSADTRLANSGNESITIDYPEDGSIFPPEITPPTFLWRDAEASAKTWSIDITFADGSEPIHVSSHGDPIRIGEIDPRCVSDTNEPPSLTKE